MEPRRPILHPNLRKPKLAKPNLWVCFPEQPFSSERKTPYKKSPKSLAQRSASAQLSFNAHLTPYIDLWVIVFKNVFRETLMLQALNRSASPRLHSRRQVTQPTNPLIAFKTTYKFLRWLQGTLSSLLHSKHYATMCLNTFQTYSKHSPRTL